MDIFTDNEEMQNYIREAEGIKNSGHRFSDVVDDEGHQYVDLVQEGGGVLGIGLAGYTFILEKAGIRFYSLAGTSAGAINTLLIAALAKVGEPVSETILGQLSKQDIFEFVDGPKGIKRLVQKAIEKEKGLLWRILLNSFPIKRQLSRNLGINPGRKFQDWITALLAGAGIHTMQDLENHRTLRPKLTYIITNAEITTDPRLAIVTSDITTHTKVEFPKMAPLYWQHPNDTNPAEFVRASMSIPFFYYPYTLKQIPDAGQKNHPQWKEWAGYEGPVPGKVRFVDGGMLSNFPINIFHRKSGVPTRPTFGARLSTWRESYSNTDNLLKMSGAMISTMRQVHDYNFLLRNTDYKQLICNIDADKEFNWLNFKMPPQRQAELFRLGAKKGLEFLKTFRWEKYKDTRKSLAEAEKKVS